MIMLNALEGIRSIPGARIFEIEGLLFAQFACPPQEEPVGMWTQTDHLLHVLTGKTSWKTATGTYFAEEGESVFFKKGAYIMPEHVEERLCVQVFFIPDTFIRKTVLEIASDLPKVSTSIELLEPTIRVKNDIGLCAFFQAMSVYFAGDEAPSEILLKIKLKELLVSILAGQHNQVLSAYLRSVAESTAPSIPMIMETNFYLNLSIEEFARMCHRSISSFKRDFQKHYGISPGRWLLERRLNHSAFLLQSTTMSVTEIAFDCGFADLSHFSKAFKGQFGQSPVMYRDLTFNHSASHI
jgi:AraC-like DNA-binding protein